MMFVGKRLVVVEDSIMRGTTLNKLVNLFRAAGAREVHVRVACPPSTGPCYYGIDTPTRSELIAARCARSVELDLGGFGAAWAGDVHTRVSHAAFPGAVTGNR